MELLGWHDEHVWVWSILWGVQAYKIRLPGRFLPLGFQNGKDQPRSVEAVAWLAMVSGKLGTGAYVCS